MSYNKERREYLREYRQQNREKVREYNRAYYHRNKNKLRAAAKQWVAENPEKVRQVKRRWTEKHREEIRLRQQKYFRTIDGCLSRKLGHLKKNKMRSRELEVEINKADLKELWNEQKGICTISGYPMEFKKSSLYTVSVDRIDPGKGYTKENVQLVCQGINFAKNKYSNEEMIEFWNRRDR